MRNHVPEELKRLGDLYRQRNQTYGDDYLRHGSIMKAIFPSGMKLNTEDEFNRYAIFKFMIAKITRYAVNWEKGGHDDSLDDIAVYAQMLKEVDNIIRARKQGE